MVDTQRLSCDVPTSCKAQAKAAASLAGVSLQDWVAEAIALRLESEGWRPRPRPRPRPATARVGD
jgi:hypothetical protein